LILLKEIDKHIQTCSKKEEDSEKVECCLCSQLFDISLIEEHEK
jgi:hypothetical protein